MDRTVYPWTTGENPVLVIAFDELIEVVRGLAAGIPREQRSERITAEHRTARVRRDGRQNPEPRGITPPTSAPAELVGSASATILATFSEYERLKLTAKRSRQRLRHRPS
jgi:hypothetical protein